MTGKDSIDSTGSNTVPGNSACYLQVDADPGATLEITVTGT